jgi:hypothetical protein
MFALDVFRESHGLWQTLAALAMHLIPSFVLVGALILAWRWEWIGAALYAAAGTLYVILTFLRPVPPVLRLIWIVSIAGPAFVISALFLLNWLKPARFTREDKQVQNS